MTNRLKAGKLSKLVHLTLGLQLLLLVAGCDEKRSPLTDRQVDELLRIPAESAEATREMVEHDARSREALVTLQAEVQQEFAEIGRRHDELEQERRAIAAQRYRAPIIASSIEAAGLLFACLLPLIVVALLLWPRQSQEEAEAVCDYLAQEVMAASESVKLAHQLPTDKRLPQPEQAPPGEELQD